MAGTYMVLPPIGSPFWADPVATSSALPSTDRVGTVRQALDSGAFYSWNGSSWSSVGNGDVTGPGSATDNAVARFDGTGGKTLQNSTVTIGDTGDVAGVAALTASGNVTLSGSTANRALTTNGSKVVTASATTDTELGYVSGVTSAIQTQINGKQASGNYITALTGDVTASGPGSVAATVAFVAASAAADVHSAELLANAATSANTASAIVKRDGSGNIVVGTVNAATSALVGAAGSPATSAALEVRSTTGAFLLPRMTSTQRDALTAVSGMLILNSTTDRIEGYMAGAWHDLTGWGA